VLSLVIIAVIFDKSIRLLCAKIVLHAAVMLLAKHWKYFVWIVPGLAYKVGLLSMPAI
jgi:hypothetical protein